MSNQESRKRRWGSSPSDHDAAQALIESCKMETARSSNTSKRKREGTDQGHDRANVLHRSSAEGDSSNKHDKPEEKKKANFGLSGALIKDAAGEGGTGHVYKGVTLKFQEPPEARTPRTQWRFYVFKGEEQIDTYHVSKQSAYLWGRNGDVADIHIQHMSTSSQHAVLQYRALPNKDGKISCQPYLMDLESTNGTFINGVKIDAARYYQLKSGDVVKFGSSTREYVLINADAKSG